jgi:hypothetical protein
MATAAAAAGAFAGIEVSAAADAAVRAEVVVAGAGEALDIRRIRIVDGLRTGGSYRLPAIGIRNRSRLPTTFRLVVPAGAARRWRLRFVPPEVVIDAGRSRAVGVRLELPDDAEPGVHAVVIGVRPGRLDAARLTFRVEPAVSTGWARRTASFTIWILPALVGAGLVVVKVRGAG